MSTIAGIFIVLADQVRAEWEPTTGGCRAFDMLDIYDSPLGDLIVTNSSYRGSTNLSAGGEH